MKALIITLSVLAAVLLLLSLVYLYLIMPSLKRKKQIMKFASHKYAHRGLHGEGVAENSLTAFRLAVDGGYGIELDVRLSKDGELVVFHDDTLDRVTEASGRVDAYDYAELSKIKLSGTEDTLPLFSEVLSLVDGKVPLLIELKGESLDSSLCPRVAEILKEYKGNYCIESFNPLLIKNMRKHLPNALYGQLYTNVVREKKKASALNILLTLMGFNFLARPDFIAYNYEYRNSFPVKLTTRFYKAEKFIWTARSKEEYDKAHTLGEHPIFEHID
jgi:glycerophosphoryl diester phosphodiesterase